MPFEPTPSLVQAIFAAPTATVSTSQVMCGLAAGSTPLCVVSPQVTGRYFVIISGLAGNTTGNGSSVQLSYGTGAAPVAGAALTGTQIGQIQTWTSLTGALTGQFVVHAIITGLAVPSVLASRLQAAPTPVWFDLAFNTVTAGTTTLTKVNILAMEI